MKLKTFSLSVMDFAAVGTWLVVFGVSLYFLPRSSDAIQANSHIIIGLFCSYIIAFVLTTRDGLWVNASKWQLVVFGIQLASAFGILVYWPLDFLPILTIIWVAMLPHFCSSRNSLLITIAVIVAWFSMRGLFWNSKSLIVQALLYSTFHFFAILMTVQTKRAEYATQKAQSLNKELIATQQLLTEASRQNERTRIARDLHDLLGHHLTALIINLQVAGHISQGEAKEKITQCHSLAKLLLSDVREAVSTLRDNQELDFALLVKLMVDNVPKLKIHLNITTLLNLEDLNLAKNLLSCISKVKFLEIVHY